MKPKQREVLGLKLVGPDMRSGNHGRGRKRYAVGGSYAKKRTHGGAPEVCSSDGFHFYQYTSNNYRFSPVDRNACVVLAVTARDHTRGDMKSVARKLTVVRALGVGVKAVHLWCKIHAMRRSNHPEWGSSASAAFLKDPSTNRLNAVVLSHNPVDHVVRTMRVPTLRQVHDTPLMPRRMNKVLLKRYRATARVHGAATARIDALHDSLPHGGGPGESHHNETK